ncbi:hypothetical protein JANAI62_15710 [Jannaschia pagri]|uniref:Uncharacterized protein n=1 Tax=Jannaschia pagri TaxID=2829797 RepID=A0ABQ4NKK3_9RHOB|nr:MULTISPECIES: hypothetical protein [unclassified Jannaschia]GIT91116.1 hypothetical protein JANAI61_15740 [Jannaschia sp. AI_61]GIT94948.1 hypothetical protein JANAI62_15710 [Jannaschia sp. AI_62]
MARKTWIDRTIEATRTETHVMCWTRTAKASPAPIKTAASA